MLMPCLSLAIRNQCLRRFGAPHYAIPLTQFEKMDAKRPGEPGGQGEYKVQTGFGWSNGVVLQLLQQYGWRPELLQERKPWLPEVGGLQVRSMQMCSRDPAAN